MVARQFPLLHLAHIEKDSQMSDVDSTAPVSFDMIPNKHGFKTIAAQLFGYWENKQLMYN